jgi:pimeloyl-ACP methyl ester carboxylesterase
VLFHDSLGSVELWREFPERLALATERSVIAYDRLGFGKSDPYPGQLGIDFIREEAQVAFPALCDQLELDGFVGFGHSVGGGMAIAAAASAERDRLLQPRLPPRASTRHRSAGST